MLHFLVAAFHFPHFHLHRPRLPRGHRHTEAVLMASCGEFLQEGGLDARKVSEGLEQGSGLVGLAGTADMREVVARRARGDCRWMRSRTR